MGIHGCFGCWVSICPTPYPTPRVQIGVLGRFPTRHPNGRKCLLKIRHLQAMGVRGVEGAVRKIFGLLYIRARNCVVDLVKKRQGAEAPCLNIVTVCWAHWPRCYHPMFVCKNTNKNFIGKIISPKFYFYTYKSKISLLFPLLVLFLSVFLQVQTAWCC